MKGGESKERLQVSCFRTMGLEGPRGIKGKLLIYSLRCSTECIDTAYMAIRSHGSIQELSCLMLFHRRQPVSRCKIFESSPPTWIRHGLIISGFVILLFV